MFIYKRKIRFQDTDAAGVIFFPNQFCFYQEAFEAFLENIGYDLATVTRKNKHHLPVIYAEADYSAPLRLGDTIEIQLKVTHVGNSSLTFQVDILKQGRIRAGRVKVVHVSVDARTRKKTSLPPSLRKKMTRLHTKTTNALLP